MIIFYLLCLLTIVKNGSIVSAYLEMNLPDSKHVFDKELYESVLNQELCEEQIQFIQANRTDVLIECEYFYNSLSHKAFKSMFKPSPVLFEPSASLLCPMKFH